MNYKSLSDTGLKVSSLCLGTMTFGDGADSVMSKKIYSKSRDKGINLFDCANGYAKGESERILGDLIHGHRDEVVIATKVYYPTGKDINARGLSRFHMTKALDDSLKRLRTDHVDLYYLHHFDDQTSLRDTLMTLNDFVRQGKVLYLGLSNFSAWQVMKAMSITKEMHLNSISYLQPMYNLLKRQAESEILPMARSENLAVFSYSPLAGGYLTGKYLLEAGAGGRFDSSKMYQKRYQSQPNIDMVKSFADFAKQHKYDPVSLAISWVMSHPDITAPIVGARNLKQLEPALASLDFPMTEDLREMLNEMTLAPALATDREEERSTG